MVRCFDWKLLVYIKAAREDLINLKLFSLYGCNWCVFFVFSLKKRVKFKTIQYYNRKLNSKVLLTLNRSIFSLFGKRKDGDWSN